jgi:O-antigen/teichoic acid export membrane protein
MSRTRIYARNLAASWIGYGVNMSLVLVTSWFVFHLLGEIRYGIFCLMMSLTGYLGMADLGLRPALYRYFNWHLGRGERGEVNKVLCTSLAFFAAATVALPVAGIVMGTFFGHVFPKTAAEYLDEVGIALPFIAVSIGLSMMASVFSALLETHERYDLSNLLDIVTAVVRSAGSILVLLLGFGLVGLSLVIVGVTVAGGLGGYCLSRRVFRDMRISYTYVNRATLRKLVAFGIPCFFSGLGIRTIFYSSSLIIAWLIGMAEVGYYSLAIMLLEYGRNLSQKGATIFTPQIQQSLAREDRAGLRYFVPLVTRVTMGVAVLTIVGIMTMGEEFLRLFYGASAAEAAGPLLGILGIGYLASSAGLQCGAVLIGAARVRSVAVIMLTEAGLNLGITVLLLTAAHMGLKGVALGAAVPTVLCSGILMSLVGIRQIGMGFAQFARQTAAYWIPASVLLWLVCFGLTQTLGSLSWAWFSVKVAVASAVYIPVAWFVILPPAQRRTVLDWLWGVGRRRQGGHGEER